MTLLLKSMEISKHLVMTDYQIKFKKSFGMILLKTNILAEYRYKVDFKSISNAIEIHVT